MSLFDYLKSIFFALIILQFIPPLVRNIYQQYTHILEPKTKVGVVTFSGSIKDAGPHLKHIEKFFKDTDIKAILLKIDSQGGTAGSSQLIYNEINALKKEYPKPVVTLVENICASGAFWIACSSDSIVAPGTALVGSIGATFSYIFQLRDFIEQYKIGYKSLKAGDYKGATDPFMHLSPEDQRMLQSLLDDTYQQFTHEVATSRKLSRANEQEWANGKIFTAKQALSLGLIDEIGSASTITQILKQKALIEGDIEWVHPSLAPGWVSQLFGGSQQQADDRSLFTQVLDATLTHVESRYSGKISA